MTTIIEFPDTVANKSINGNPVSPFINNTPFKSAITVQMNGV